MCQKCKAGHPVDHKLAEVTRVRRIGNRLPNVVDKVFGVPLKNREFPTIVQGAYKTRKGHRVLEHALLYTGGLGSLPNQRLINELRPDDEVLVRVNSGCFTGDIFHDESCDCNWQMWEALRMMERWDGPGLLIYHFGDEGKAHGYLEKLRAYDPKTGMYPVRGDKRDFTHAIAILKDLGITRVRLMTNNPHKRAALGHFGIRVTGTEHVLSQDPSLRKFLHFKAEALGHEIPFTSDGEAKLAKEDCQAQGK